MKLIFYGWKITNDAEQLFTRMGGALRKILAQKNPSKIPIEESFVDVAAYGQTVHKEGWGIAFGQAIKHIEDNESKVVALRDVDFYFAGQENAAYRAAGLEALRKLSDRILAEIKTPAIPEATVHAETVNGITIGTKGTDIQLDENEVRLVSKIRDLLKCKKIVITRGDLKIETVYEDAP